MSIFLSGQAMGAHADPTGATREPLRRGPDPVVSGPAASEPAATGMPQRHTGKGNDGLLRFASVGPVQLEAGGFLPDVTLAYETWGALNADSSNAILIHHALTGSTHVTQGDSDDAGWWEELVGPGAPVDTTKFFVVSVNMLGGCYGSTGPASTAPDGRPWGSRFPLITLRDTVEVEERLADQLDIATWHAVVGGSLGGARALEWAISRPDRVQRCGVIACGPTSTAEQIAFAQAQTLAIRQDRDFNDGDYYGGPLPDAGLALARRIAHITYRSAAELDNRFGRQPQQLEQPLQAQALAQRGRYQVESYLDHQGNKLVGRFDANSYVVITEALMSHDITRGRGTLGEALGRTSAQFFIAAVTSDRLYFPAESESLAAALPTPVDVHMISAGIGHDAFLTDIAQVAEPLRLHLSQ